MSKKVDPSKKLFRICPKCGSTKVSLNDENKLRGVFGTNMANYTCMSCGHTSTFFPEVPLNKVKEVQKEFDVDVSDVKKSDNKPLVKPVTHEFRHGEFGGVARAANKHFHDESNVVKPIPLNYRSYYVLSSKILAFVFLLGAVIFIVAALNPTTEVCENETFKLGCEQVPTPPSERNFLFSMAGIFLLFSFGAWRFALFFDKRIKKSQP